MTLNGEMALILRYFTAFGSFRGALRKSVLRFRSICLRSCDIAVKMNFLLVLVTVLFFRSIGRRSSCVFSYVKRHCYRGKLVCVCVCVNPACDLRCSTSSFQCLKMRKQTQYMVQFYPGENRHTCISYKSLTHWLHIDGQ